MEKITNFVFDVLMGYILKIIGIVMICAVLLQIAFRYLPISGTTWTEELGRLTFLWFCFLSTAVTYSKGQHLFIDYFYLKMNKLLQRICDFLSLALILAFASVITIYGIQLLEFVAKQHSPVMRLSFFWFYLSVPVGCGFVMLFAILSFVKLIFFKDKDDVTQNSSGQVAG